MANIFKTPLGNFVSLTDLNPRVIGSAVQWNASLTEVLPGQLQAQRYLAALLARLAAVVSPAIYIEDFSAAVILDVLPNPFTATPHGAGPTPGDTIAVYGVGFTSATLGTLHIEDWPGSLQDDNGLTMTCTFVSGTKLTAVFASAGDFNPFSGTGASTAGNVGMYYRDSLGTPSNTLLAAVNATSVVTMATN